MGVGDALLPVATLNVIDGQNPRQRRCPQFRHLSGRFGQVDNGRNSVRLDVFKTPLKLGGRSSKRKAAYFPASPLRYSILTSSNCAFTALSSL